MSWLIIFVFLNSVLLVLSINRPVYKISLTQKGYAQFLQYDVDTPPLREFTFCTWFRVHELSSDQSILTYYVANGSNRVLRLWLDSGGRNIKLSINGKTMSTVPVEITKGVWRNICLSYQSDYGAWAIYMDSRLISCQASMTVSGFVLPGNGSLIVGYGTSSDGEQNGLEGEIFGANMILISTIERNFSVKNNPQYEQKLFHRNEMRGGETNAKYIILGDLQTDEVNNNFETTANVPFINSTKNYIKIKTPFSYVAHEVGLDIEKKKVIKEPGDYNNFPFSIPDKNNNDNIIDNWNLNEYTTDKDMTFYKNKSPLSISEYEVPPPAPPKLKNKPLEEKLPSTESIFSILKQRERSRFGIKQSEELSEVETPPPLDTNTKVYGQWTSSKFAGNVLNYLKSIQSRNKEKWRALVPQTIPLGKLSDHFPYASNLVGAKVRPPPQFQRKSVVEKQVFESIRTPQINVRILGNDLRSNILKNHALIFAKNVEINNRGMRKHQGGRFYRNANYEEEDSHESSTFTKNSFRLNKLNLPKPKTKTQLANANLISILPFLKSLEYFVRDPENKETKENNDVYTRSLSNRNKWHNVKSYSNDYTPREIQMGLENPQQNLDEKMDMLSKRLLPLRLKYKQGDDKEVPYNDEQSILKGRKLAKEISDQSQSMVNSISIIKYNHGYLPNDEMNLSGKDSWSNTYENQQRYVNQKSKNNFNKHVKIGNALNEQPIIGDNVEQNKKSFIGGDERIPDIHKYRPYAEKNNVYKMIPGSLSPKVCKNVEFYDRLLYVQPDGSIDTRHIISSITVSSNIGIEFIIQNYKKCSLEESKLQNNIKLFINWSKTPVRLFGGAYPMKTTDLCGFF